MNTRCFRAVAVAPVDDDRRAMGGKHGIEEALAPETRRRLSLPHCLRGCRFDEEGLPSDCPGEGFACIRASAETDEGICYPVDPCRGPADCAEGEVCRPWQGTGACG